MTKGLARQTLFTAPTPLNFQSTDSVRYRSQRGSPGTSRIPFSVRAGIKNNEKEFQRRFQYRTNLFFIIFQERRDKRNLSASVKAEDTVHWSNSLFP